MHASPAMATETQNLPAPYLSVVVTSRNDGHGGDPLARLQAFVNTFDAQCSRFKLDAELVVVEWNPPPERPRLHELVRRPPSCSFTLRFLEVPSALHARLPRAHVLPLFQMIGKNAGIRRARGRFVLSTNIDIIFSNELVEFFATRALRPGVMYRVDRHDVKSDYPIEATLDEQLSYCSRHQLRIHCSSGTYPVDPRGRMVPLSPDVFDPPSVTIGDGWHIREGDQSLGLYRWATENASLIVNRAGTEPAAGTALALDIEPNPYDPGSWVELEIADGACSLTRARISDRRLLCVPLANAAGRREVVLRTVAAPPSSERSLPAFERRAGLFYRLRSARLTQWSIPLARLRSYDMNRWRDANRDVLSERTSEGIAVRSAPARQSYCLRYGPLYAPRADRYTFAVDCTCSEGNVALHVVDEWSNYWIPSNQYEMADGNRRRLFASLNLKCGQVCSLYIANHYRGGDGVSRFVVHSVSGSVPLNELELRKNARVLLLAARRVASKMLRSATRLARVLFPSSTGASRPIQHDAQERPAPQSTANASGNVELTARIEAYCKQHRLPVVHRNAAGDFQLMAREHWVELHGYPEFTMYSMNVDGLLGDIAHHAGVTDEVLAMPRCIYHLEHAEGSGWTPEGEGLLRKRLADSGADWLDAATVDLWSAYMGWLKRPMIFNGSDWGVGDAALPETTLETVVDKA